jgi:hypothetical protein
LVPSSTWKDRNHPGFEIILVLKSFVATQTATQKKQQ